jgi:hypothetical protein
MTMKQHDEHTELDNRLKSLDSIRLEEPDKQEVYSNLRTSMENQKHRSKVFQWPNHVLTAAFVAIFLMGGGYFIATNTIWEQAAPQDENIDVIETVLEKTFSGPTEEFKTILDKKEAYIQKNNGQEYQNELLSYYQKEYGPYFEENRLQDHLMTNKLTFLELAGAKGYQLEAAKIDSKKEENNEDAYEFTVDVHYKSADNQTSVTKISGRVNIYETGKINTIRFYEDGGLAELVQAIQTGS